MDSLVIGLAAGVAAFADRVLDRRARRQQRDRLMEAIPVLPPGSQVGEWYGNGGWWITVPQRVLEG
jgi:hypothetical protein